MTQRFVSWPAHHPAAALVISAVAIALCALAVGRMRPSASLESMLSKDDPAVKAVVRVLNEFPAAEDMLVLATAPANQTGRPDPDQLIAFAKRLEQAIRTSPQASALCDAVSYQAGPEMREYFEKVLVPNGLYYLDRESFEAAKARLTRDQMIEQFRQNEALISAPGPAASAMAKVFLKDPLRLHEFVMDRLMGGRPFKTYQNSEAFVSADGRSILIRIGGKHPPSDLDASKAMTAVVTRLANDVNADHLEVDVSGAYAITAASATAIRSDMIESVFSSVAFLAILFLVAYRRPTRLFVIGFIPVAVGVLYGFGIYSVIATQLTPLTAVIGGILAGMGIDYSIQHVSSYQTNRVLGLRPVEAAEATMSTLGPALFAAWATSIVGFVAITWSKVQALRDFALLGSLGLTGAFFGTLFILPAILVLADRRPKGSVAISAPRIDLAPALRWIRSHAALCVSACGIVFLVATAIVVAKGRWLSLESDLSVMHPKPNPALDAQLKIARRMGTSPGSLIVYLKADTPPELVTLAHRVRERLTSKENRDAGVVGSYGLATLLPDPTLTEERRAAVGPALAKQVVTDFRAAVAQSAFAPEAFEPYVGFLDHLLTRTDPPTVKDVLARPELAKTVLPRDALLGKEPPIESMTLVFLDRPLEDATTRGAAIAAIRNSLKDLPGATLTGLSVISHDTQAAIQSDLPKLTLLALGIVLLYLFVQLRTLTEPLATLVPTLFSLMLTLAVMHLLGQRLNMVNLVTIPLLIGIDVDYAVFIVSVARLRRREPSARVFEAKLVASCHAIVMCAASTILGFGSLIFTSVPAVRSLGLAVAVGVFTCLLATIFCLLPLVAPLPAGRSDAAVEETEVEREVVHD